MHPNEYKLYKHILKIINRILYGQTNSDTTKLFGANSSLPKLWNNLNALIDFCDSN